MTRLAWTVIGRLPVVQCVQVSRTGNVLAGLHGRYNRKVVEQAAIAGVLRPKIFGDLPKAMKILNIK